MRKKNGFTLIELLVVMIIIAILSAIALPAIIKARQQASVNKVMAEMTSFASTSASIYMDLKSKGYVRLCDYDAVDAGIPLPSSGNFLTGPQKINNTIIGYAEANFTGNPIVNPDFNGTTGAESQTGFQNCWDGPYAVYQPNTTFDLTIGKFPKKSVLGVVSDLVALDDLTPTVWSPAKFPTGTPLDAWGHPYGMGWNAAEQVMVIYSAGPNGIFEVIPGLSITVAAPSDDLLYKFR